MPIRMVCHSSIGTSLPARALVVAAETEPPRGSGQYAERASDQIVRCRLALNSHVQVAPHPWTAVGAGYDAAALERLAVLSADAFYGPEALIDSLASGAIAGLRGSYVLKMAEHGERIKRRQDMPAEAFMPAAELRRLVEKIGKGCEGRFGACDWGLLFVALSYRCHLPTGLRTRGSPPVDVWRADPCSPSPARPQVADAGASGPRRPPPGHRGAHARQVPAAKVPRRPSTFLSSFPSGRDV